MDQPSGFLPNGMEVARAKLEPIIAEMLDDERAGTDLMRAFFHTYLNVRFIGQSNMLIAVFQDLLEAGCEYRDVFNGMVEAHKNLKRSPRWINVLKDMQPDHVIVQDRDDPDGKHAAWAVLRPPHRFSPWKPSTEVVKTPPQENTEPEKIVSNDLPAVDPLPE